MKIFSKGVLILILFFILVFAGAFYCNPNFPQLIVVGENSVGTWMSGVLLIVCATVCLVLAMQRQGTYWFFIVLFFFILALDERFMFHEQLKEQLIFNFRGKSKLFYELPVIIGAMVGGYVVMVLWKRFNSSSRIFLMTALSLGTISVIMDIFSFGVLIEDSCKLVAELCVSCAFLIRINE